ncbi:universal stress protein [Paenibacillus sp. KN14-4R]|uniref:universal stress protein n=1 Tax=Paenibacillus sp. KN14-4R TaxID=3445773 RepID=UPI003FA0E962
MSFSKILVAYDGSDLSNKALHQAIALASGREVQIDVVHVFQIPVFIIGEGVLSPPASKELEVYNNAQAILDEAKEVVDRIADAPTTNYYLVQGEQSEGILAQAAESGSDIIVIGNRGMTGMREFMLGSVSHHVAQHSKIPVLIVK